MDKYLDEKYTVINGILLACTDQSDDIEIPSSAGGHTIRRIADGCCVNRKVRNISIAEGITELGTHALWAGRDHRIDNMSLPASLRVFKDIIEPEFWEEHRHVVLKRRCSLSQFESMEAESLHLENKYRLLDKDHGGKYAFPGLEDNIWEGFRGICNAPAGFLCREMLGLYMIGKYPKNTENKGNTSAFKSGGDYLKQFIFKGCTDMYDTSFTFDPARFRRNMAGILLKMPQEQVFTNGFELENDKRPWESNDIDSIRKVLLVYYSADDVSKENEEITFNINIESGRVFFPELKDVVVSQEHYFIYTENYLCASESMPYRRFVYEDEVYDASGRKAPADIARRAAAKYRLASMLT